MKSYKRGDVHWVNFDPSVGTEIQKIRPAVIVSNNVGNRDSTRLIVAPITSKVKVVFAFEVKTKINKTECKILLDQIRATDKSRVCDLICTLDSEEMKLVDKALKIALGLA